MAPVAWSSGVTNTRTMVTVTQYVVIDLVKGLSKVKIYCVNSEVFLKCIEYITIVLHLLCRGTLPRQTPCWLVLIRF